MKRILIYTALFALLAGRMAAALAADRVPWAHNASGPIAAPTPAPKCASVPDGSPVQCPPLAVDSLPRVSYTTR